MTAPGPGPDEVRLGTPRVEHRRDGLGVGLPAPRVSVPLLGAPPGWQQSSVELEVAHADGSTTVARTTTDGRRLLPWPAAPLGSRERVAVRARVHGGSSDRGPAPSPWSPPLQVEAGLLHADDWQARFVTPAWPVEPDAAQPPPLLRRGFTLDAAPAVARLHVTALGLFEVELNGRRVGDLELAPGWTSYHHRLRVHTFDVTDHLTAGGNAVGAWLSEGWYAGHLGFYGGSRSVYGSRLGLLAQLEVELADGTRSVAVATDRHWRAAAGPLTRSGLYAGETFRAPLAEDGWSSHGYDDAGWHDVEVLARGTAELVAPVGPPARVTQDVPVARVVDASDERVVLDFGQNLVGRCRIRVDGPAGSTVTLRHAEVLQDGELEVRPLRTAAATDEYTLRGGGPEEWEPRFTFHGFRYAEVAGWPGTLDPQDVTARVVQSDLERTGWFGCSDPLVERLHENIVWSMRGNFLHVPTDCPQRDERLGWTGDIQVFAPTACFLYDCTGFLDSWLADVAAEQLPDGTVPYFVPRIPAPMWEPVQPIAVWGDAAVLVPWTLYEHSGDPEVLARHYPMARRWVELVASRSHDHLWRGDFQLGDWLDPVAPPDAPAEARADADLVATAHLARSADVLARTAQVLGEADDARRYAALAADVRTAFAAHYLGPDGRTTDDAPTSYALALWFGLVPRDRRAGAAARLATLVREGGDVIPTGFAGTPAICHALADAGQVDAAYALLTNTDCPSWLYPVTQGATTVWERWDSLRPDGSVNPGRMTSFNHYALGAVGDWLHRTVAGLGQFDPTTGRFAVRPRPGGGLTHAWARQRTLDGDAEVAWQVDGDTLVVEVTVPTGRTASIELEGRATTTVGPGRHIARAPWPPPDRPQAAARPS